MHDIRWWFGVMSGVVSLLAYIPLVIAWKRGWEPHRATWSIWVFVSGIIGASMVAAGAWETAFIPFGYCIGSFTLSVLSFKRGTGGWSILDRWCIAVAGAGMVFWIITKNPITALALNIIADAAAAFPTAWKLWQKPKSEDPLGWSFFFLGAALSLFAVRKWNFAETAYPIYLTAAVGVIFLMTLRPAHTK